MALNAVSNVELWNTLRGKYGTFASHTSKATKELFTEQGWEALKRTDSAAINDFFELSIRTYLLDVKAPNVIDPLEKGGFGEKYTNPMGGYIQRIAINSIKPVSPAYKNLKNFSSIDPYVIRKPEASERFFKQNFDYQSVITISDEYQMKQIFISEFGMSEFMAGIMTALANGYKKQNYYNKLEVLNKLLNSTDWPLKETQKVEITLSDEPTSEEMTNFVLAVKNTVSAMTAGPSTSAFNSYGYDTYQSADRLKLLIRPGYKNILETKVLPTIYHDEKLSLPVEVIEVQNFGGLTPYNQYSGKELHEVYDELGALKGYSEEGKTDILPENSDKIAWNDANENVIAILADKGAIFEAQQNGYSVEPIRNPRGLYTNYWASSPNNSVVSDPIANLVEFLKKSE